MSLPLCMGVIRLEDGGLLLYSPVPLDGDLPDQIRAQGEVHHIVAPSLFHHLHVGPAMSLFEDARVWCAPGLSDKRSDLKGMEDLPQQSPFPGVDVVHIDGIPKLNEVCLHHRASSSLLCSDLIFNIPSQQVGGWLGGVFTWMMGTGDGLAQSRAWKFFSRDKVATAASIQRVLALGAERVLMGHGEPLLERGTERMAQVMFLK